jgi:hypothetical protein
MASALEGHNPLDGNDSLELDDVLETMGSPRLPTKLEPIQATMQAGFG